MLGINHCFLQAHIFPIIASTNSPAPAIKKGKGTIIPEDA